MNQNEEMSWCEGQEILEKKLMEELLADCAVCKHFCPVPDILCEDFELIDD